MKSYAEIRNKNVIRQHYEQSCGASSIATLINFFNIKKISEADVLKKYNPNKLITDMVSFLELQQMASELGYESKGYQLKKDILNKLNIPVIVKIENDPRFPHFVVIINYSGDFIKVLDPSFGEYISTKKDFYDLWDKQNNGGYALILDPKDSNFKIDELNIPVIKDHIN